MNESLANVPKEDDNFLAQEISSIIELGSILKEKENFLKQVAQYHEMNASLIQENNALKNKVFEC